MKKLVVLIVFITLSWASFAQDSGILYTDFEPDWCIVTRWIGSRDTLKVDFDRDNETDLMIELVNYKEPDLNFIPMEGWHFRYRTYITSDIPIDYDTLVSIAPHGWWTTPRTFYYFYSGHVVFGIRKVVDDSTFCYGWFDLGWINACGYIGNGQEYEYKFYACIKEMSYCTVPNYPLRWGQTTMTGIAEDEDDSFVSLYPNPTTGVVNIKGERLRQVEIFNNLGQRIALVQCSDEEFSVDMKGLPSGLYYAAIIDAAGRRYTRKIVKE